MTQYIHIYQKQLFLGLCMLNILVSTIYKFLYRRVTPLFLAACTFMKEIICFKGVSELDVSYKSLAVPLRML